MNIPERKSTLRLTHFGHRSKKPYQVTIWFVLVGGELWIGSLDENRGWVRNLRAGGSGQVDFGAGPLEVVAEELRGETERATHRAAVAAKYPILSRVIAFMVRGKTPAVFRLRSATDSSVRA